MKKRGFGKGRWNGFGGKLNQGETIEISAIREVREEVGLKVLGMQKRAILNFEFEGEVETIEVHVFAVLEYRGEPRETEEMAPKWFELSQIPYGEMWPDDIYWLPKFLSGKKVKGKFYFKNQDDLITHKLEEVKLLP